MNHSGVAYSLDAAGILAILASLLGWLPPLALLMAIAWYGLQMWESRTVQAWVQRRHERRIMRLAAKLAALQLKTAAQAASMELKGAAHAAAQTLKEDAKKAVSDASKTV